MRVYPQPTERPRTQPSYFRRCASSTRTATAVSISEPPQVTPVESFANSCNDTCGTTFVRCHGRPCGTKVCCVSSRTLKRQVLPAAYLDGGPHVIHQVFRVMLLSDQAQPLLLNHELVPQGRHMRQLAPEVGHKAVRLLAPRLHIAQDHAGKVASVCIPVEVLAVLWCTTFVLCPYKT